MIFILIFVKIDCNMMLYFLVSLRTGSIPADINRFQSHTGIIFTHRRSRDTACAEQKMHNAANDYGGHGEDS